MPARAFIAALAAVLGLSGCGRPDEDPLAVSAPIGEPLPGLDAAERVRFEAGRAVFVRQFTPSEGLGPRFNENACNACHTDPADGGTGETSVRKATRLGADGRCDLLAEAGGENLRRQVTPAAADRGSDRARTPEGATHTATFTIPFLFGLGLVDAVPAATLQALADPGGADGDGISGRVGTDAAGRPARFGRKADAATLADFVEGAFRLEMGLTTPTFPDEVRAGGSPPLPPEADPASEPEVEQAAVRAATDFVRFLAPPEPAPRSADPTVARGGALFASLGCDACHTPALRAGDDPSPAIANRSIALYSDLLLHDMGPDLAGTCAPGASPSEYRTEPLVGLRWRETYLHDGRAGRVRDAVLLHGGEASAARDAFAALDRVTQEALLRFLATL